ncbi:MAG: vWA domain-containing protein [Planctomycetota bacterium]
MVRNRPRRPAFGALGCRRTDRRGATLVLIAVMSTALVSLGALVINWSYIELTHTQLRAASDAAAKAAAVTLSQTQNQGDARRTARQIAREYRVGGRQVTLRNSDIVFGNGESDGAGGYTFNQGEQPLNSARVTARCGSGSSMSSVPVFFSNIMPEGTFDLEKQSTAGRYDHDICVVVDRSASMAWDLSSVDFQYPAEYVDDSTLQNYFKPPHPTESRWAKLVESLGVFRDVVNRRNLNPQIALVSYASNYTFGVFQSSRVSRDQLLDKDTDLFVDEANRLGGVPLIGDTNISAGLSNGRSVLLSRSERRVTANRTMILFSDGVRTEGGNPVQQAQRAANSRITVHTVSFGDGADQQAMQQIAQTGGGNHYHANTGIELESAFEQIAEQLPAVLIQ